MHALVACRGSKHVHHMGLTWRSLHKVLKRSRV